MKMNQIVVVVAAYAIAGAVLAGGSATCTTPTGGTIIAGGTGTSGTVASGGER